MMKNIRFFLITLLAGGLSVSCSHRPASGVHTLTILSTNDVHGAWFDSTYVGGRVKPSLMAIQYYADSVRRADGAENVLLIDVGDCLQGDNAAYYYNYVDTASPHLFPRLVKYMGYDALAWGNHDVETGHAVYDRVQAQLTAAGAPFLAGNAIREDNGKSYFPLYRIVCKAGLRVAVLGYENANIKAWLGEELWSGMHFEPIVARLQQDVDYVRRREQPDVVVVAMHSASGKGDGSILESEALDAFQSVQGVDWILCGHDHRPLVKATSERGFLNSGSHCRFLAHGKMQITVQKGQITEKSFQASLIKVDAHKADSAMRAHFRPEFETVRDFTLREVGSLDTDLRTRDAYAGMCPYMNLLHFLGLGQAPAQVSIAAPLTFNGQVKAGTLLFNDLFTIYPFENQLYIIRMSGREIREYLEASYDRWIGTVSHPGEHVLKMEQRDNPRTGQKGWSLVNPAYNFDSAAGLCYTVDITRPRGQRVHISSLADGSPFNEECLFNVALTSYRASGGGGLLDEIGIDTDRIGDRTVARYPEIRSLLYDYLREEGAIRAATVGNPAVIGHWEFVPRRLATDALRTDMALMFGK